MLVFVLVKIKSPFAVSAGSLHWKLLRDYCWLLLLKVVDVCSSVWGRAAAIVAVQDGYIPMCA